MSNYGKQAGDYIGAGLAVMPTKAKDGLPKYPAVSEVVPIRSQPLTAGEFTELEEGRPIRGGAIKPTGKTEGIAILTGAVSGGLELLDIDTKYDLTGTLWADLSKAIQTELPDLWPLLTIAETISGGRHILYRCETISGNKKLASRPATEEERAKGETKHALLETRGEGGYLVAAPTQGYKLTQGSYLSIPTITPEQRTALWCIAADFDQLPEEEPTQTTKERKPKEDGSPLTPMGDYNERGDVVGLLASHGWKVVRRSGQRVYLLRSGSPSSAISGNWHEGKRRLYVFSTSTSLPAEKPLSATDVFNVLECGGDLKETTRKLRAMNYGDPYQPKQRERAVPQSAATIDPEPPIILEEVGISVNIVNRVTGEATNIPDLTQLDTHRETAGEVVVTGNGNTSQALKAARATRRLGRRIYIEEDGTQYALWQYALKALIERHSGQLDAMGEDALLQDVVKTGLELEPLDRDRYLKAFTDLEEVKESGVKLETLQTIAEQLETTRAKEKQREAVKGLLREAQTQAEEGKVSEAIDTLTEGLPEARAISMEAELGKLLIPTSEAEVMAKMANAPEGIELDYTMWEYEAERKRYKEPWPLTLPAGALTVIAGASGHGKTSFMINAALQATDKAKGGVVFFSYEESKEAVTIKTLVSFMGHPISADSRRTAFSFYRGKGDADWIKTEAQPLFDGKRREFFSKFIDTGRLNIQDVTPPAEALCDTIRYLHKERELGAVFIDYIQLLRLKAKQRSSSRQEELSHICDLLKIVAKETGLPIILGAQFNRTVTNPMQMEYTRIRDCLLYTSPSPRDGLLSRMPSSA